MKGIYTKYKERGGKAVFQCEHPQRYVSLVQDILTIASSDSYVRDMQLSSKLTDLLTYLMEDAWTVDEQSKTTDTHDTHTNPKKQLVRSVKDYIDEHYPHSLSLQTLASLFYINKEYLAAIFKETYGYTVNSYIAHVRISKAKEMLRFTDKTVEEIGREVGIEDGNYFSRVFKRVEGVSPKKYRERYFPTLSFIFSLFCRFIDNVYLNYATSLMTRFDNLVEWDMQCPAFFYLVP